MRFNTTTTANVYANHVSGEYFIAFGKRDLVKRHHVSMWDARWRWSVLGSVDHVVKKIQRGVEGYADNAELIKVINKFDKCGGELR